MLKPLAEGIYWVGAVDWDLRRIHGYNTQRGSSYNSYLIIDEKIALIDTVKASFAPRLMERVSAFIDPAGIDYIISLHGGMDHSSGLPYIMEKAPNAKLITGTPEGIKILEAHLGPLAIMPVKTGDILSLGSRSLHFLQTPMLHWPDNTMAYLPEEGILFSGDAFGQHYAACARRDNEVPGDTLFYEALKYYGNILLPFGSQTKTVLDATGDLDIKTIAPAHGIIWRTSEGIKKIRAQYAKWAVQSTVNKAAVVYDTMWNSTKAMAEAITDGFCEAGIPVKLLSLGQNQVSDIIAELLEAKYIAIGSPTLNNNLLPSMAGFLSYLRGLGIKNRTGLAFGSYGWSGQGAGQIQDTLRELNWNLPYKPISQVYIPKAEELAQLKARIKNMVTEAGES